MAMHSDWLPARRSLLDKITEAHANDKKRTDLFAPFAAKRGIADRYPELFFIPTFLWYTVPSIMGGKQKLALSDILKDDTEAERVFKIVCEQEEY